MSHSVLSLDPRTYQPHPLHAPDRVWCETNCAVDLWIEALHALGLDPVAALAFTLGTDFDGEQWRMFKYPVEDLRCLFGVEVDELNVWRPLVEHVAEQLALGRMVTVDVDAWHLPDTAGLTYHCAHQKTTIMVQLLDRDRRRLGYFHNTAYFELDGDDFDAVLGTGASEDPASLPPYVEGVGLDRVRDPGPGARDVARRLVPAHLARRPATNPVLRMRKRIEEDMAWLVEHGLDAFHRYAFGSLRQCGANAELASTFVEWLDGSAGAPNRAADALSTLASGMKSVEFVLARAVRGRACDLGAAFAPLEEAWDEAMADLVARHGG